MKKTMLAVAILMGGTTLAYLGARTLDRPGAADAPPSVSMKDWAGGLEARGVKVSAGVWDLQSGKLVEGWHETDPLTPASTTKALTTYALMKAWKPNYTVPTEIWGDLEQDTVKGDLVIKGGGDPLLVDEQIWGIAESLKKLGVTKITGRIVADQSAFDGQLYGNGWEDTTRNTWPTLAALSVDFNRAAEGSPYTTDPTAFAESTITRILAGDGIAIEGKSERGSAPKLLMTHDSPPLRELVGDINKFSNNFMIETLVKRYGDGNSAKGVQKVLGFYKTNFGFGPEQLQLTDACGLSKQNRIAARTLAIVMRAAWFDFQAGPEYVASLKVIGAEPFKLRKHKDGDLLSDRIRVKSGYLDGARSLAGYLQMPDGRVRVFAIILNGESKDEDIWEQVARWSE
ncbi:MAG: D-alanyl-D-alanine carboxypeptidase [Acidobacteria bacterium]|nr:D-alanyl-D-alanine carboxypeptidase [Acidobacteriota bacterium]